MEKVILLSKIREIIHVKEVQNIIKSYAFYDKRSISFREKMTKTLFPLIRSIKTRPIHTLIQNSYIIDDMHWTFITDNVHLQGINCRRCGEYYQISLAWVHTYPKLPTCNHILELDAYEIEMIDE